jgi:hypothetical protein
MQVWLFLCCASVVVPLVIATSLHRLLSSVSVAIAAIDASDS